MRHFLKKTDLRTTQETKHFKIDAKTSGEVETEVYRALFIILSPLTFYVGDAQLLTVLPNIIII